MTITFTVESVVTQMKKDILADMRNGHVPLFVQTFSDLHEHVDANCYGNLCDDAFMDAVIEQFGGRDEHEGMPDAVLAIINMAQDVITGWITRDGHKQDLCTNYRHTSGQMYTVVAVSGGTVKITPQGGGFVSNVNAVEFFKDCKPVTGDPEYRPCIVSVDGVESMFRAYSNGYRWNGWAIPLFEKEQLLEIVALFKHSLCFGQAQYVKFNEVLDASAWYDESEEEWISGAVQEIETADGDTVEVYPLGDGWCWNHIAWFDEI